MQFKLVGRLGAMLGVAALVIVASASSALAQDGPMVNATDGAGIDSYMFDPGTLTVNAGDTVMWTNTGTQPHTITASDASFDSGLVNPGDSFMYTFAAPGTFTYTCTPHPWMKGTITVGG